MKFASRVIIDADSWEQAGAVLIERLGHDEDYGFPYRIVSWEPPLPLPSEDQEDA